MKREYVFSLNEIKVIAKILGYSWILGLWDFAQLDDHSKSAQSEIVELQKNNLIQIPFGGEIYVDVDVRMLFEALCNPTRIETCCKDNEPVYSVYSNNQLSIILKRIGFSKYSFKCYDTDSIISPTMLLGDFTTHLFDISDTLMKQWHESINSFDKQSVQLSVQHLYGCFSDLIMGFIEGQLNCYVFHVYSRIMEYYKDEYCASFVDYKGSLFQIRPENEKILAFYMTNLDVKDVLYGEYNRYDNGFIK